MKITALFRIAIVLFGLVLVAAIGFLILANGQLDRLDGQEEIAKNVERSSSDLAYLSNDYLLYGENRQRVQWENKSASLSKQVTSVQSGSRAQQAIIDSIKDNQARLGKVFGEVVKATNAGRATGAGSLQPLNQVSWSRLAVLNQAISFDAQRLSHLLSDQKTAAGQRNSTLILILFGIFGIYFATNYTLVYRRTMRSIKELQQGAETVGSGNLDYSIPGRRNDEIGELTRSFNQMTQDLKSVTISKSELENEIASRREAEIALQSANEELQSFAYSVSHDLRAPLRSIDGFSQILLEDYGGKLDKAGLDHLDRVRESSQKMSKLIDGLLILSRVARRELNRQALDITGLSKKIISDLRAKNPDRDVKFTVASSLVADGDEALVIDVLENLLRNAWKFTSRKGVAEIEVGSVQQTSEAVFFVRDNGVGFDMKHSDKLFGPFSRLHNATEFPGTGIGLATVQRIIHHHGGRIWAESEPGKGATFYFTLTPGPN